MWGGGCVHFAYVVILYVEMRTLINPILNLDFLPSPVFTITKLNDFYQVPCFYQVSHRFLKSEYNLSTVMKIFLRFQVPIYCPGVHTFRVAFRLLLQIQSFTLESSDPEGFKTSNLH